MDEVPPCRKNSSSGEINCFGGHAVFPNEILVDYARVWQHPPEATTGAASGVSVNQATLNGTVHPNGPDTHYYFEYGTTTSYGSDQPAPPGTDAGSGTASVGAATALSGLTPGTTYHYRLVASSSAGTSYGGDQSFTTPPAAPAVTVEAANNFQPGGLATLHGTVNPGNGPTHYRFEWGTSEAYGNKAPVPDGELAAGLSPQSLERAITGLSGHTTYYYRLFAENSGGTGEAKGSFTTPGWTPAITAEPASAIKAHSAIINAEVNPEGFDTTYYFEYGLTTSYGTKIPAVAEDIGSSTANVGAAQPISGLTLNTFYHYRVVATNANGTIKGPDREFKTIGPPLTLTESAIHLNTFTPQLIGNVNPEGADTHYYFEYGPTPAYGSKVPLTPEDIGSAKQLKEVRAALSGLQDNATYHFRVVAENEAGLSKGEDSFFKTLAPCKNGTENCTWSTQATVNPVARNEAKIAGVACATATRCVAVGENPYTEGGFLETWNGAQWQMEYQLSGYSGGMRSVSCPSATYCMVVGETTNSAEMRSWKLEYAEAGGESYWTLLSKAVPLPAGATTAELRSVSCKATTACTAVGSQNHGQDLIETWNGTSWSAQAAPAEGNGPEAMRAVSCPTSSSCVAVGTLASKPTAETWNGTSWSPSVAPPLPGGVSEGAFEGVSCSSASACTAVGNYREATSPFNRRTLAESWNGVAWTIQASPNPAEAKGNVNLHAVSCLSESSCFAVGQYVSAGEAGEVTEEKTLAESWNGVAWTIQASPNPAGAKFSSLTGVSCNSATACTAAGSSKPGTGSTIETLAERYE
ncbi:MAG: hypothetical protein ACTHK6_00470 [Solirubrobacterales bacterium]